MFTLPELPYAYNALEPYIDEQTMRIHHDKHHGAYVKNLNDALLGHDELLTVPVEDLLKDLTKIPEDIRMKVRNNGGGHANHSLFWTLLSANASGQVRVPGGTVKSAIDTAFGSFEKFQELFAAKAMGRFGSGWAWLVSDSGRLGLEDTGNQDTPVSGGKYPILALDVWEHAYYLKYQNLRADYIKNWWNVVNWTEVEKRYATAG